MKPLRLLALLFLVSAAAAAWPFPHNCGPYPVCGEGCDAPPNEYCWALAEDLVASGAAMTCDNGDGPDTGICLL